MPATAEIVRVRLPEPLCLDQSAAVLVGRDREVAELRAFVGTAITDGGLLVVTGGPGHGKTALAAEAERLARAAGMTVSRRSPAGHGPLPRAREHSGLIVVDDADRLDRQSAAALAFAARRLGGTRTSILITSRRPAAEVLGWEPTTSLRLDPLSPAAAAELLRRTGPSLGFRARQRILDDARGNPAALVRLPCLLTAEERAGSVRLPLALPLDARLRQVFGAPLAQLAPHTRHVLLLAALEPDVRLDELTAALGRSPLAALAGAERAGIAHLGDGRTRIDFAHPLIAAAVIAESDPLLRRAVHQQLSRALRRRPELAAWHRAEALNQVDSPSPRLRQDEAISLRVRQDEADRLYRAGAWDQADREAAETIRLGDLCGSSEAVRAGERIRGLIRNARETADHNDNHALGTDRAFERALRRSTVAWCPFETARIHLAFGEHLRRTGRSAVARVHLDAAHETFRRLRARPWALRAAQELRAAGRIIPATALVAEAPAMTGQEQMIAQLAAAGLTNKQIAARMHLSHRTVGAHLYRLFPKIGITTRAGLRDALSTLDFNTVQPIVRGADAA